VNRGEDIRPDLWVKVKDTILSGYYPLSLAPDAENGSKRRLVVVVGIPGVGKTTVVELLVKQLSNNVRKPLLVNFGSVMLEQASKLFSIRSRDDMRKMRIENQKELQVHAASHISNLRNGFIIVDTHLFISTPEGFWPGMPLDVLQALRPTHLVLISASATDILARRAKDTTRSRDKADVDSIEREIGVAETMLFTSSVICGCPAQIVINHENEAEQAAEQILRTVR
jgi:adenylate kinase